MVGPISKYVRFPSIDTNSFPGLAWVITDGPIKLQNIVIMLANVRTIVTKINAEEYTLKDSYDNLDNTIFHISIITNSFFWQH